MEQLKLENEWIEKYDFKTGKLKSDLSRECYDWAKNNHKRTEELIDTEIKKILNESYTNIIKVLKEYIDTTDYNYKIIAMWIIGTYFHNEFNTFPYLFLNAMKGSGKTRTLKLISALGSKGDGSVQNNLTEAVLFRIPKGTTTCIDELEGIGKKEKQTLRELLNSAYKKGMKVKRMKKIKTPGGEMYVTETFEPYFPIAMANIWGIEEVLADRSIVLILEKSNNQSITKMIEDFDVNPEIISIKRTLEQFSDVSAVTIRKKNYINDWNNYIKHKYNNVTSSLTSLTPLTSLTSLTPHEQLNILEKDEFFNKIDNLGIFGRNLELFFPFMLLAEEMGILEDILCICSHVIKSKKEDEFAESKDISLYDYIWSINSRGLDYIYIKELTHGFRQFIGEQEEEDRWLNEKWMSRALKRLNLVLDSRKLSQGRQVTLNFQKAFSKLKIFKETNEIVGMDNVKTS